MAKMGLSVRDDPPKVVDLTIRSWGEIQDGFVLSIADIPREDSESLPRVSVLIRNVSQERKEFIVPGWLFFFEVEVRFPDGSRQPLGPFGRGLLSPERRTERIPVSLAPGDFHEMEIPIGSLFNLRAKGTYDVTVSGEPVAGVRLTSNRIRIG